MNFEAEREKVFGDFSVAAFKLLARLIFRHKRHVVLGLSQNLMFHPLCVRLVGLRADLNKYVAHSNTLYET